MSKLNMSDSDQFKFGFLMGCAEDQCNHDEINKRVKVASFWRTLGTAGTDVGKLYLKFPFLLAALGIGGSGVMGAAGGLGLARLQDVDIDPDAIKQQELINAYNLQSDIVKNRMRNKQYRETKPTPPSFL